MIAIMKYMFRSPVAKMRGLNAKAKNFNEEYESDYQQRKASGNTVGVKASKAAITAASNTADWFSYHNVLGKFKATVLSLAVLVVLFSVVSATMEINSINNGIADSKLAAKQ